MTPHVRASAELPWAMRGAVSGRVRAGQRPGLGRAFACAKFDCSRASELVENGPCATGPIELVIVRGAIDGQATNLSLNFALGSTGSENAAMAKFSANLAAKITS